MPHIPQIIIDAAVAALQEHTAVAETAPEQAPACSTSTEFQDGARAAAHVIDTMKATAVIEAVTASIRVNALLEAAEWLESVVMPGKTASERLRNFASAEIREEVARAAAPRPVAAGELESSVAA